MRIGVCAIVLLLLLPGVLSNEAASSDEVSSVEFNNRPSVPASYHVSLDGISCTFAYESVGGSSELWSLRLERVDEANNPRHYRCVVGRPEQSSYLVFLSYALQVTGGQIKDVVVVDGELRPVFPDNNFVVQKKKKSGAPASVTSDPTFRGVISGLSVDIQKSAKK